MAKFKYFEPADLAEALSLLQNYGDAFYAAGESDQGLTSTAARRFSVLAGRGL
jgi:CO/xanthine dehydrogenase FAD-binding subunit